MAILTRELVHRALFGLDDEEVRKNFLDHFGDQIQQFETNMIAVFERWLNFEKASQKDKNSGTVVVILLTVIARLIQSMNLLITGNIALAGAAKRQVIEAIALALLFSKQELPYLQQAWERKFSVNTAVDKIIRYHKKLNLNREALKVMKMSHNFYDQLSHPTIFSMSDTIQLDSPGNYYLGSSFDKSKLQGYQFEIDSRVSLSNILISIIEGVTRQMREWPYFAE